MSNAPATSEPSAVDGIFQPLGAGMSYYAAKGGILYRSREGFVAFAPDADAFARAIGAEVERVLRRAMNGELVDAAALAARSKQIAEEALASGVDLSAFGLK